MTQDLPLARDFPSTDERRWRAVVTKALKSADFDATLVSRTEEGLEIKPLYTRTDEGPTALPRAIPVERPWDIRQLCAEPNLAAANAAILEELAGGAASITLRLAAPEQTGIPITSERDLAAALKDVELEATGLWIEPGACFYDAARALQVLWKQRAIGGERLRGGVGADPLGSMARAGGLPISLDQAMESCAEIVKHVRDGFPHVAALLADARPYHDGGADAAQELACLCATATAYLRACESSGIAPVLALPHIDLALAADTDLFLTVAKMRAARLLIARIAEVSDAASALPSVRLHATTSQRMMTGRDVHSNMLRTTVACAGAALGGADAVTVLPFTWTLGQPDRFARRIARNIQLLLMEESFLGQVADPAGGSWYADRLTEDLARRAWHTFQEFERFGGMAQALATGGVQATIRDSADKRRRRLATSQEKIIGVSMFANLTEADRHAEPWPVPEDLDPAVTVEPIPLRRPAEAFEALRDASDAYMNKHGHRPQVLLVNLGRTVEFTDRATYAVRVFAAGGIEAVRTEGFETADQAVQGIEGSDISLACLCGSDAAYAELAPGICAALKSVGAKHIYSVGRPGERRESLSSAGVGTFLYEGCDMIQILRDAQSMLGVRAFIG